MLHAKFIHFTARKFEFETCFKISWLNNDVYLPLSLSSFTPLDKAVIGSLQVHCVEGGGTGLAEGPEGAWYRVQEAPPAL